MKQLGYKIDSMLRRYQLIDERGFLELRTGFISHGSKLGNVLKKNTPSPCQYTCLTDKFERVKRSKSMQEVEGYKFDARS